MQSITEDLKLKSVSVVDSIIKEIIRISDNELKNREFFSSLRSDNIHLEELYYVLWQYHYWRDCFHKWFGTCIQLSGSCENEFEALAISHLADHIVVEIKDSHYKLYMDFLSAVGVPLEKYSVIPPSAKTLAYINSFSDRFSGTDNCFYTAISALSGRELFASVRNRFLISELKDKFQVKECEWLSLHQELEIDHFEEMIYPVVYRSFFKELDATSFVMDSVIMEIEKHCEYWDDLYKEGIEFMKDNDDFSASLI